MISTAATLFDDDSGLAYEPITIGDQIAAKLAGSPQGKANLAAVLEAARVLAATSPNG